MTFANSPYRNSYHNDLDTPDEEQTTPPGTAQSAPANDNEPEIDPATGELISNAEPSTPEEVTFKKRYGDLRRFLQEKERGWKKQYDTLQTQLDSATKQGVQLPKTEEEIEEWARQYPDVAKIVESIAMKKVEERFREVDGKFQQVEEMKRTTARERAEVELLRLHPDFDDIRGDQAFHDWAAAQPKWVQDALYQNDDDAKAAARAVDLYKLDKGIGKRGRPRKDAGAAEEVRSTGRSTPSAAPQVNTIKESEVQKMSPREYDAREDEIMAARREGRFIYDLSGKAM